MKKIFTLIAATLMAVGAMAQTTIMDFTVSTSNDKNVAIETTGGTVELHGTTIEEKNSIVGLKMDSDSKYTEIVLTEALQKDDKVTFTIHMNGTPSEDNKEGIAIYNNKMTNEGVEELGKLYLTTKDGKKAVKVTYTATGGEQRLNLYRLVSSIYFVGVKITRGETEPEPEPTEKLGEWDFSIWDKTTLTSNFVRNGLTITAMAPTINSEGDEEVHNVVIEDNNKTVDGVNYTKRVKTGGKGTAEARALAFNVSGPSTIKVICCSASGNEERTFNIVVKGEVLQTLPAVAGNPVAQTYEYTGVANDIYIEAVKGVNYYAVYATNVTGNAPDLAAEIEYEKGTSGISSTTIAAPAQVKKQLRNGQIVIETANGTFNAVGAQVK